jgi:hypothetical protein
MLVRNEKGSFEKRTYSLHTSPYSFIQALLLIADLNQHRFFLKTLKYRALSDFPKQRLPAVLCPYLVSQYTELKSLVKDCYRPLPYLVRADAL